MNLIGEHIRYLPASDDPLSADVYFIEGNNNCYIYDVGNNADSLDQINRISKDKTIIISHYHKDHVGNIDRVDCRNLYVGKKTYEIIGKGNIVENVLTIHDGVKIDIIHCISPHTDGSLIINIDNTYTLIADLYFTRPPFEKKKAMEMLQTLKNIDTKFFVISHQTDGNVISKETLLAELSDYFNQ